MITYKKNILIVSYGLEIGGIERSLIGLLDALDYKNYTVDLFLFSHDGEFMHMINPNANLLPQNIQMQFVKKRIVDVFRKGYFKLGFIRLYAKLIDATIEKTLKKPGSLMSRVCRMADKYYPDIDKQYDLALGFFGPFDYLLNHTKARIKVGWVHTDYTKVLVDNEYELKNWKQLDYIAAVSDESKNTFLSVFSSLKQKMIVIENILDAQFVRKQANAFDVLTEMPRDGSIRVCSVGRFCEAKAFDEAALACKKLIEHGYDIKWYIIGYGPHEAILHRIVKDNKLENHFIILGKKENPYPYMKACDIYAQPSRYEGKAVTVREAQMLGKPVIITNFSTAKSQLENNIDGYICPLGINGVVNGIKYLIDNPEFCKKLSNNTLIKDYSNLDEIEKIYKLIHSK